MMSGVAGTHPRPFDALLYAGYNYFALVHICNTIAAKTSRAPPTRDDLSDSMTSITTDRS